MSRLGPNERHLLEALRAADEPSEDDRARVRARVLVASATTLGAASIAAKAAAAPGAGVAGTASVAPPVAGAALGTAFSSWKAATAVVALVGLAGGATWVASTPGDAVPAATSTVVAPSPARVEHPATLLAPPPRPTAPPEAHPIPTATTEPKTAPAARSASPRARPRPARKAAAPRMTLDRELALLEQAQRALEQGDSRRALAALDQHAEEHPGGVLGRERRGIAAIALCQAGETIEGERAARSFVSDNPKSPMAARVRAACLSRKK